MLTLATWLKLLKALGSNLEELLAVTIFFSHSELSEIVNLQNVGGKSKSYQLKQFIALIEKYNLQMGGLE